MNEPRSEPAQPEPMSETWPYGMPYTVHFPEADGSPTGGAAADLEYPAHLPRVGDLVEYLKAEGEPRRYRVREVVHTLQASTGQPPGQVRAGLPKVFLEAIEG